MNLHITGHHVEVTPAIREYVSSKLDRVLRHFDNVIEVNVILTVEKLKQKAEVTVRVPGKDIYVENEDSDLYASVDALVDKLDRQVIKHKEKGLAHNRDSMGTGRPLVLNHHIAGPIPAKIQAFIFAIQQKRLTGVADAEFGQIPAGRQLGRINPNGT